MNGSRCRSFGIWTALRKDIATGLWSLEHGFRQADPFIA